MNGNAIYFFRVRNTDKTDSEGKDLGFEYEKIRTRQAASNEDVEFGRNEA